MKKLLTTTACLLMTILATAQSFQFDEMTYSPEQTVFKLFAPATAKRVKVRIYQEGLGGKAVKSAKMKYENGLWTATVPGNLMGRFYTFDAGFGETPSESHCHRACDR